MQLFSLHNNPRLLLTVLTSFAQGVLLLWLHLALQGDHWPAQSPGWLAALYAVSLFVPVTIHLTSEHWRTRTLWWVVAAMGALYFYAGWHFGYTVGAPVNRSMDWDQGFVFFAVLALVWLHFLPFLRLRLTTGRWRGEYEHLFASAWQQAIMLAEAALFTGLFWALLMLWAGLFRMLDYGFFQWLFTEPSFAYPFTAVAFGVALYLTGSLDKLVTVVREQLLGLLKWLAPVAGLILILFAPTLLFKLPDLVFQGERAIGAGWLLWLLAFTVLLLNAGYQNGRVEQPYPRVFGVFLRIVIPATVVVGATALYSTFVRIAEYGVTVTRFFAMIVALAAMVYAIGYTVAALRRGRWLQGIERVNVGLAVGIIIVLVLTLTPIASPYRLSAASQSSRALSASDKELLSALHALRFDTGAYGQRALERLAKLPGDDKQSEQVRRQAQLMLKQDNRWAAAQKVLDPQTVFADIVVYPTGRQLDARLLETLRANHQALTPSFARMADEAKPVAILIDLNADSLEDCVIIVGSYYSLFTQREHGWVHIGGSGPLTVPMNFTALKKALEAGDFTATPRQWQDLRIDKHTLRMPDAPDFRPERPAPAH